ncbi:hypothetical protein NMG60_11022340 [Bertholletia excelsa]
MEFELENPMTSFKEHQPDTVPSLFANESDHMPSYHFSHSSRARLCNASLRREAISVILQARFTCNCDPFIPYLAVNYVDRFISKQEIPQQGKKWIARLLAVSSLSLAAKMKNLQLPLSDIQGHDGFNFDAQSVQRMELHILATLNWRMRSITPFSFLHFFLSLCDFEDPQLTQAVKDRASDIIFRCHYDIKLLEYKPSIIAASALLCVSQDLLPQQFPCFKSAIFSCEFVNKERLLKCFSALQDTVMQGYETMFDVVIGGMKVPDCVLDCLCTVSKSEITMAASGDTFLAERDKIKRRKMNGLCRDHSVPLSQIQQC